MSKKPNFKTNLEKRLVKAKEELKQEKGIKNVETKQTTIVLEADLLYAAKEVALKRKRLGIEPSTVTGMIREALKEIVEKSSKL